MQFFSQGKFNLSKLYFSTLCPYFIHPLQPKLHPKMRKMLQIFFKKTFSPVARQGFIQAILMSGRQHRKLNLLIEFKNSIFKKINLKNVIVELAFKIN